MQTVPKLYTRAPNGAFVPVARENIVGYALDSMREALARTGPQFSSPQQLKDHARISIGFLERESFGAYFLDAQHRFITWEVLFTGTLAQTAVYPREVVRAALKHNAAAVIFTHNHPSGSLEPSRADELLTANLKNALGTVDVRVLDHVIVSLNGATSMAERGLI